MTTANMKQLHEALEIWSKAATRSYDVQSVYVFGSLIHKDGEQFNESSDIDLVVVMPTLDNAVARHRWLETFSKSKDDLESQLMRLLRRSALEPSASVVAVTDLELSLDIHKDGHREFFTANTFLDLQTGDKTEGLPGAKADPGSRFVAAGLAFAQKMRNEFFAVSANGTAHLVSYDGSDPLPKRIMRAAAMAARATGASSGPGAEHDVKEGLDLLTDVLYRRRSDAPAYKQLHDIVSVRRHSRGKYQPVEPAHQLLLGEIIYDLVSEVGGPASTDSSTGGPSVAGRAPPATSQSSSHKAIATEAIREDAVSGVLSAEPYGSTTAFFAERFASAFPGTRAVAWHHEADDIKQRLLTLLREPLSFSNGHPIWWWRGGSLQIESFREISTGTFLMNVEELKIARIAAVPGSTYQRSFVYVRVDPMEPTGLYKVRSSDRSGAVEQMGYEYEEYGLVSSKTPITRAQYDDGAATIDGKLVQVYDRAELRIRYITPYNFLIASNGSPINNARFDEVLVQHLNEALVGDAEGTVERIRTLVEKLPLRGVPNA